MARYIDEEILINGINNRVTNSLIRGWLASIIDETPTADVVEVVKKPVKDYEGYYEVDQFGRVYSVDRVISVNDNGRQYEKPLKAKQMKQSVHTKGYKTVSLTKNGKTKTIFVHRIVAEAFISNENNLPMVNHKDEDKTNNFIENLEWCTVQYNNTYGNAQKKKSQKLKGVSLSEEHKNKISMSMKNHYCSYGERKCDNG